MPKAAVKPIEIYTIGYGGLVYEAFLDLIKDFGIETLVDVRSKPYSKNFPEFRKKNLETMRRKEGIRYVFLGDELGGMPDGEEFYTDGRVDFEKVAASLKFQLGIGRLLAEARNGRTAIMCVEENPRRCHRRLLITPALLDQGVLVRHIRSDGRMDLEEEMEEEQYSLF